MVENRELIAGVLGVAFNKKGEVLLTQRREPNVPQEHARWQLPGGALEFGEHPEETLRREMREELKTEVTIVSPGPIIRSRTFEKQDTNQGTITFYHLLMLAYIVTLTNTNVDISGDPEASAVAWVPIKKIPTLQTLPLVPGIVAEARQRLGKRTV